MEYKHTLEVLQLQVQEIAGIIENFEKTGNIPLIEFDILLEKFRNIYDLSSELRSAIERDHQNKPKVTEQGKNRFIENSAEKSAPEKIIEHTQKKSMGNGFPADVDMESKSVSDRFKDSRHILNDEITEKKIYEDVSMQYKSKPISSIKNGLSLSEKFELINQLFKGNKEKFEHTIDVLDTAGSFVEACNYIESHFNWDMNDVYVQRILELIRRKLIVGRNEK